MGRAFLFQNFTPFRVNGALDFGNGPTVPDQPYRMKVSSYNRQTRFEGAEDMEFPVANAAFEVVKNRLECYVGVTV
jgi:hypothetical protein